MKPPPMLPRICGCCAVTTMGGVCGMYDWAAAPPQAPINRPIVINARTIRTPLYARSTNRNDNRLVNRAGAEARFGRRRAVFILLGFILRKIRAVMVNARYPATRTARNPLLIELRYKLRR